MSNQVARPTPYPGIQPARSNRFVTAEEQTFMVADGQGTPYLQTDCGNDGNGLTSPERYLDFMPDGQTVSAGRALVGKEGVVTRTFSPRYRLLELAMRNICGLPVSDTTIESGARRKIVWTYPDYEAPAIMTRTGYYGWGTHAVQLLGGRIVALNIDASRNADGGSCGGSIAYHFNHLIQPVSMPGTVAQDERKTITATNATGSALFAIPHPTNPAIGTTNLAIAPGASAASIQTALRLIAGYADALVTGSTNGLVAGLANPSVAPTLAPDSGTIAAGNQVVAYTYVNANGETPPSPTATINLVGSAAGIQGTAPALPVGATGTKWYMSMTPGSVILGLVATSATNTATWNAPPAGGAAAPPSSNTTAPSNNVSNGTYTFDFPVSLHNINVAAWPQNGGNGWTSATVRDGSNGTGPTILHGPFLKPNDVRLYIATNDADLATIDMLNIPNERGEGGDSHLLATAPASTWGMANLWNYFYPLNGHSHPTDFVAGTRDNTLGVQLPKDDSITSDWTWFMNASKGCLTPGFWFSRRFVCGGFEYWQDAYVSRNAAADYGADNNVNLNTFPLAPVENPDGTGSRRFTLILPTSGP